MVNPCTAYRMLHDFVPLSKGTIPVIVDYSCDRDTIPVIVIPIL